MVLELKSSGKSINSERKNNIMKLKLTLVLSITLAKDLGNGLSASAMLVDTNAKSSSYTWGGKYVGKSGAVVGLKYSF